MRLFTTRKRVAELCAANRETLAHVVDKRAMFLLLMCIDHTLRAICCGSIRHAQGRMQECDSEEFAECVIESHPLYAFMLSECCWRATCTTDRETGAGCREACTSL